jgi:nucleoside-diphosphate-sugar epimerase
VKQVFVTGGSGYVGRNLIRALVAQGVQVNALARSERSAETVRALGATPVAGDLHDVDAMTQGMRGCQVAFHAAAMAEEWGTLQEFRHVNVQGTACVLQAVHAAQLPRLVHVSSEAVLCDGSVIHDADETWPLPAHNVGGYPTSKAEAERLLLDQAECTLVIVRPRFIWGRDDTTVWPRIEQAARAGRFRWVHDGTYPSSSCHVANCVHGLILAATRGRDRGIYFVTDGPARTIRASLEAMGAARGVDLGTKSMSRRFARAAAAVFELLWTWLPLRGEPPLTRQMVLLAGQEVTVRDDAARNELGYEPVVTWPQGLDELRTGSWPEW